MRDSGGLQDGRLAARRRVAIWVEKPRLGALMVGAFPSTYGNFSDPMWV